MGEDISKAEIQLCVTAKNIRRPSFTANELRAFGAVIFKDALEDWASAFERLCQLNAFRREGEHYSLTEQGEAYVEKVVASEFFGRMLVRAEQSRAFGRFCERVYGRNLTQFGTADMGQLEKFVAVLGLNDRSRVLDLGCGVGATAEYISDLTGAQITGIDLSEPAVERARERTRGKADRLSFLVADLNRIDLPPASFDTVIAVDTLYFAKDLAQTVGRMKAVLQSTGQMGLFFSEVLTPNDPPEQLAADQTKLGRALEANGLTFAAHDLTESNLQFWRRSQEAIEEMKPEFEEGNKDLCEGRIVEGGAVLALASAGRMSRYLYHARVSR